MIPFNHSSGDMLADRRFEYGEGLMADGDAAAAAELFEQALERAPDWAAAWAALGAARLASGDRAGAAEAYRAALRFAPADPFAASLKLALIEGTQAPESPPDAYVRDLFDQYAPKFEAALVGDLDYRAPGLIAALIDRAAGGAGFGRALDLGCGTGLMGEEIRAAARHLEGVDLSAAMVDAAAGKRADGRPLYDALSVGDVVAHLAASRECYDLIVAADVFCYLGNLAPVFEAAAARMGQGGLFAFSVERGEDAGSGWTLRDSMRFAHGRGYLEDTAGQAGFAISSFEEADLRRDRGVPVGGYLVVLRR